MGIYLFCAEKEYVRHYQHEYPHRPRVLHSLHTTFFPFLLRRSSSSASASFTPTSSLPALPFLPPSPSLSLTQQGHKHRVNNRQTAPIQSDNWMHPATGSAQHTKQESCNVNSERSKSGNTYSGSAMIPPENTRSEKNQRSNK